MAAEPDQRRADLVAALGAVRARIADACAAAGRDQHSVTMIAVTKTYPATDVVTLAGLGVLDFGENREQEARAKVAEVADLLPETGLRWHFVGQVQTNKAARISRYAFAVHGMDRQDLVAAFAKATRERTTNPLEAFVQVSLDGDMSRGGLPEADVARLADAVAAAPGLRLAGLMAVPPLGSDPDECFARLARISELVRTTHPGADAISAGMSADLEAAVRHGATHVRVGTALLGRRRPTFS